ncbi:unnamed protein product [Urochloa humidicola]
MRNPDALVTPDVSVIPVTHATTTTPPLVTPTSDWVTPSLNSVTQEDISASQVTPQAPIYEGPVTRSRAKKLQQEVHAFLSELHHNIDENVILPKSRTLLLLRFTHKEIALGYAKEAVGYATPTKIAAEASTSRQCLYHLGKIREA